MTASARWERKLTELTKAITGAACAYEARWTLAALHRVDPDIHARMRRQTELWLEAARRGTEDEIVTQGEALVRGYRRAVEVMSAAGESDDSYWIGRDEASGLVIAIGHQVAAADRVVALHPDAAFFTPDELAGLLNSLDGFRAIAEMKRLFPGAVALPQRPALHA